jgi:phage terminase small subunit
MSEELKTDETEDALEGSKLNDRQLAFCREYTLDFKPTDAAIRAGYTDNRESAQVHASRLLSKAMIRTEIDRILKEREDSQREEIRARVLEELSKIAMDDINGSDAMRDKDGNVLGVNRKDRLKALELLGKYSALFVDKLEIKNDGPIVIKYDDGINGDSNGKQE